MRPIFNRIKSILNIKALCEKSQNTEIFLVRIFPYLDTFHTFSASAMKNPEHNVNFV